MTATPKAKPVKAWKRIDGVGFIEITLFWISTTATEGHDNG